MELILCTVCNGSFSPTIKWQSFNDCQKELHTYTVKEGIQRRFWKDTGIYYAARDSFLLEAKKFPVASSKSSITTFLVGFSAHTAAHQTILYKIAICQVWRDQTQNCHSVSDSAVNKYVLRSSWLILIEIGLQAKMKKKNQLLT